ncbi:MAG: hypothetical protein ACFFFK_11970 [Candidatus Thorarchaeota archaeon]
MKLSDILLSLFVEFCVLITVGSFITLILRPYIPQEQTTRIGVLILVGIIGTISLMLAGAGSKRNVGQCGLSIVFLIGAILIVAGLYEVLYDLLGVFYSIIFIVPFVIARIGFEFSHSQWIDRLVIIKRNPEYEEREEPATRDPSEPLGELFG